MRDIFNINATNINFKIMWPHQTIPITEKNIMKGVFETKTLIKKLLGKKQTMEINTLVMTEKMSSKDVKTTRATLTQIAR